MSGLKVSTVDLAAEQRRRREAIQEAQRAVREADGVRDELRRLVEAVPAGLRTEYAPLVAQADALLRAAAESPAPDIGSSATEHAAREAGRAAQRRAEEGRRALSSLSDAVHRDAPERVKALERSAAAARAGLAGAATLLERWRGADAETRHAAGIDAALSAASRGELHAAEARIEAISADQARDIAECEALEEQHARRLETLQAVRQLCADMGFTEAEPVRYEREGDRTSPVVLPVKTARGPVTFYLSLSGIAADSALSHEHCYGDLDRLSDALEEEYGIRTRFGPDDGSPRPQGKLKGSLDEPTGRAREAGVSG